MKKNLFDMLMVTVLTVFLVLLFAKSSTGQSVAVNNNGAVANNSAMLDISSTTKGMLTPRMTSAERNAIVTPAEGLIVYDTDVKGFWYYSNNTWQEISKGLTLPYAGATYSLTKVFSIANNSTTDGSAAIYGQTSNQGSGHGLNTTAGVWGDNSTGNGVYGTSNTGLGIAGLSSQNHGVFGSTVSSQFAGVHGMHANNGIGVLGLVTGGGAGVYGQAQGVIGKAAMFENSHVSNTDTVMKISQKGSGVGIAVDVSNNQKGLAVLNKGSGAAIYAKSENGTSALFENNSNNNTSPLVRLMNESSGNYALAVSQNNTNSTKTAVVIENYGTEKSLLLNSYNTANNKYLVSGTQLGTGGGIELSINSPDATGDGININNFGSGSAIDAKNISGTTIYALNTGASGRAIRGSATGSDGVAIYGEAGNSASNSYAGYFRNANSLNSRNVVQIDNLGTGNFLSLTNGLGDVKTTITKVGNITTDGTVTVKNNKGIVRNTGSTQLRYEVIPAAITGSLDINQWMEHTINFPTPFSSPPAVSVGNMTVQGAIGAYVCCSIVSVTATSCKFITRNVSSYDLGINAVWNLIVIGAE